MPSKPHTKDENFVIALYEAAKAAGDLEIPLDRYEVGARVPLNERAVNAICRLLVQANFIKKSGEDQIYLTPHGIKLAESLLFD